MEPHRAASRQQIREVDRIAIEEYGVPGLVLMENAGRHCACTALEMLQNSAGKQAVIACGTGNNAGDGFVVARHLANQGVEVRVLLTGDSKRILERQGETSVNFGVVRRMGIPVREVTSPEQAATALEEAAGADLVVDALLGTGISGPVREPFVSMIRAINGCTCPVMAVDVPSGLDCDTGRPHGNAVHAEVTVTFVCMKLGFLEPGAELYTGRVEVVDIGAPYGALYKALAAG
jgi:NAD(P)H-hydrate epimerase